MTRNLIIIIGGCRGVGKTTFAKKLAEAANFGYLNTGIIYKTSGSSFEFSIEQMLANLSSSTVIDTHFAVDNTNSEVEFTAGFSKKLLERIHQSSTMDFSVLLIDAPSQDIYSRRRDETRSRLLDLNSISIERSKNLAYSKLYASTLNCPCIYFDNSDWAPISAKISSFMQFIRSDLLQCPPGNQWLKNAWEGDSHNSRLRVIQDDLSQ